MQIYQKLDAGEDKMGRGRLRRDNKSGYGKTICQGKIPKGQKLSCGPHYDCTWNADCVEKYGAGWDCMSWGEGHNYQCCNMHGHNPW